MHPHIAKEASPVMGPGLQSHHSMEGSAPQRHYAARQLSASLRLCCPSWTIGAPGRAFPLLLLSHHNQTQRLQFPKAPPPPPPGRPDQRGQPLKPFTPTDLQNRFLQCLAYLDY
jgi:hypothetical protein